MVVGGCVGAVIGRCVGVRVGGRVGVRVGSGCAWGCSKVEIALEIAPRWLGDGAKSAKKPNAQAFDPAS